MLPELPRSQAWTSALTHSVFTQPHPTKRSIREEGLRHRFSHRRGSLCTCLLRSLYPSMVDMVDMYEPKHAAGETFTAVKQLVLEQYTVQLQLHFT